ncbi:MAG: hypothetical protein D6715_12995 [Calditrichaeota bacterium]|nr:MAG: hypothetical protein D6715_12995 [Calditrichota bacterium]
MVSGKKPRKHLAIWLIVLAFLPLLLTGGLGNAGCNSPTIDQVLPFQEGDLVFQVSKLPWHRIMGQFSLFPVNHCGIVLKEGDKFYVLEAGQKVQKVPLTFWVNRGEKKRFMIARFKGMNDSLRNRIHRLAQLYLGKPYDFKLSWDDEAYYNAELVRKIFQQAAGVYLGPILRVQTGQLEGNFSAKASPAPSSARPIKQTQVLEIATPVSLLRDRRMEIVFSNF